MEKLKIGIIGCGGIANAKHLPSLSKLPELCEIVAFCDLIPQRAQEAAEKYGAPDAKTYTDYRELLADPKIDVVHVLTPNAAHCQITIDAFEAGKHVMCEKPMAPTAADAQRMIDAACRAGKKFTIGYQNRFREDAQTLYKACRQGALGHVYFAKAHATRRKAVPTWGVFTNKELQGGGCLIDIGTHALDLTLWCMDNYEPESVSGSVYYELGKNPEGNKFGDWDPETFDVEDSAFGYIKMKDGATIFLESSWALNTTDFKEAACTLCGTQGGAELLVDGAQRTVKFNTAKYGQLMDEEIAPKGLVSYYSGESKEPGYLEARQWLQSILNDTEPLVRPEQALAVTRILEAIYRSFEEKREVRF